MIARLYRTKQNSIYTKGKLNDNTGETRNEERRIDSLRKHTRRSQKNRSTKGISFLQEDIEGMPRKISREQHKNLKLFRIIPSISCVVLKRKL